MKKFLVKLIQKYFLKTDSRYRSGDVVYYGDNQHEYEFVGIYYSYELNPFVFIRDPVDGRIFGVPMNLTRTPYTR